MKTNWKISILTGVLGALFIFSGNALANPHLANYYLGVLPSDPDSIAKFAKTDLLILSPDQFITRVEVILDLKKRNPDIILLAYVPTQSYNTKYWPYDLIFGKMQIRDDWWLRDRSGNVVSNWPGLNNLNIDKSWSEYLVKFINENINHLPHVDGIFFDIVNESIADVNGGNLVLGNAKSDSELNSEWAQRMAYLLDHARENLNTKYIVINGSSYEEFQPHVNGRMYETFPTPWEFGGSWSKIMTRLEKNKGKNLQPKLYIFNTNTNNTGHKDDYRKMRFGIASSLLTDNVFFSFDFGDQNHGQIWWYDEYDVNLGTPTGSAESKNGAPLFAEDVWKREFTNGLAVVNPTGEDQTVYLGGEYEKIRGTQDKRVNDGSVVEKIKLSPKDGLLLYKTYSTVDNVLFSNGNFLRFYDQSGNRTRNGFFAFETGLSAGSKIFKGDLDLSFGIEKIIVGKNKVEMFDSYGSLLNFAYPFGNAYKGSLNLAVGNVTGTPESEIIVGGSTGGKMAIYDSKGELIQKDIFPLGKKFTKAIVPAITSGEIAILAENELVIMDLKFNIKKRLYPFGKAYKGPVAMASGDFNGDGVKELALAFVKNKKPVVLMYSGSGKKLKEFTIQGMTSVKAISLGSADLSGKKVDEIVVMATN